MKKILLVLGLLSQSLIYAQYAPEVGVIGSTAIKADSTIIVNWANSVLDLTRGYQNIANGIPYTTNGEAINALGSTQLGGSLISLGDSGVITLGFEYPIKNGPGHDFAVFENSFSNTFLELAHIEVSTNGIDFIRLPSVSLTQTSIQVGGFGNTDPTKLYNLAGKYKAGYGTPFDLEDIIDSTGINLDSINYVRVIDVIGTLNAVYANYDSQGNIINDPYPTNFSAGGFDLDAIAVINENKFLDVSENELELHTIYPNPSKGNITINSKVDSEIDIISINGQIINHFKVLKNSNLSINNLKAGIYLIRFNSDKKNIIKKIIVNQ